MSEVHAAHVAALDALQEALAQLYGVEGFHGVAPFLLSDQDLEDLAETAAIRPRPGAREEVFVLEEEGQLSVALYLDEGARQAAADAMAGGTVTLNPRGFADFCVALEGISHLLLVSHRAGRDLPVTQLEMELQAEVDKYVVARLFPWAHVELLSQPGCEPRVAVHVDNPDVPDEHALQDTLFELWRPATNLEDEQVERYVTASRYAHRYCRHLERRFLRPQRGHALRHEVRQFYRMGQAQRLHHIHTHHAA